MQYSFRPVSITSITVFTRKVKLFGKTGQLIWINRIILMHKFVIHMYILGFRVNSGMTIPNTVLLDTSECATCINPHMSRVDSKTRPPPRRAKISRHYLLRVARGGSQIVSV